jgi:hypothetical protein
MGESLRVLLQRNESHERGGEARYIGNKRSLSMSNRQTVQANSKSLPAFAPLNKLHQVVIRQVQVVTRFPVPVKGGLI